MIIKGDSRRIPLKDGSVNCIVTSPPYYALRKYSIPDLVWDDPGGCEHKWGNRIIVQKRGVAGTGNTGNHSKIIDGQDTHQEQGQFCLKCNAFRGQLGLEPTIDLYLSHLLQIIDECKRVLRDDGTMWVNISDSYASGKGTCFNPGGGENSLEKKKKEEGHVYPLNRGNKSDLERQGLQPKSLCLIPERFAIAMVERGWICRSDIIWAKPNPMPESVTDRPTRSHEYIFMFVKSRKYYFDQEAVREPHTWVDSSGKRIGSNTIGQIAKRKRFDPSMAGGGTKALTHSGSSMNHPNGRNVRSVWTIPTKPFPQAHYAVFPEALVSRCIKAGCPVGGIVLDPFAGSGTTLRVAEALGREAIGIDLGYQELQFKRVANTQKEMF